MIEGFKIRVTCDELKSHLQSRADYHAKRADVKEAELPGIKEAMEKFKLNMAPPQVSLMNKFNASYNLDPQDAIESLERDITNHRNSTLVFRFFAEHLFPEDYVLDEAALKRLEILKS